MSDIVTASISAIGPTLKTLPFSCAPANHAEFSVAQAALSSAVGRGCHVDMLKSGATAGMQLLLHMAAQESQDWSQAINLSGGFGKLQIAQGERLLHALSGLHVTSQATQSAAHWQWLQAALCGRLGKTPFSDVTHVDWDHLPYAHASVLRITLQSETHSISVLARASATHWLNWLDGLSWKRSQLPWRQSLALPLEIPILLAKHSMPAVAAQRLKKGDIILPSDPLFDCFGHGRVPFGMRTLEVQMMRTGKLNVIAISTHLGIHAMENTDAAQSSALVIDSGARTVVSEENQALPEVNFFSSHEHPPAAAIRDADDIDAADRQNQDKAQQLSGLDSVPLTLSFELGRSQTTVGQLRELAAGTIMTIHGASSSSIAILSGHYRVGSGEIVDVGGQIGIRIVRWGASV